MLNSFKSIVGVPRLISAALCNILCNIFFSNMYCSLYIVSNIFVEESVYGFEKCYQ